MDRDKWGRPRAWKSQVPGGGNNIPESHLKKFSLRGAEPSETTEQLPMFLDKFVRNEL